MVVSLDVSTNSHHRQPKLRVGGKKFISNDIFKILYDFLWEILIFAVDRKKSLKL